MSHQIDWSYTQQRAKKMTVAELLFAIADCRKSVIAMGNHEYFGKDANYYRDEGSVYYMELKARKC